MFVHRIPVAPREELKSEGVPGKSGAQHQFVDNQNQHSENGYAAEQHDEFEDVIAGFAAGPTKRRRGLSSRWREAANLRRINRLRTMHIRPR